MCHLHRIITFLNDDDLGACTHVLVLSHISIPQLTIHIMTTPVSLPWQNPALIHINCDPQQLSASIVLVLRERSKGLPRLGRDLVGSGVLAAVDFFLWDSFELGLVGVLLEAGDIGVGRFD